MLISDVGIVAIGRNEGARFVACLASLPAEVPAIYVDSGSTDDSIERARAAGLEVVELPTPPGFTAARARNAGWRRLLADHPGIRFVQFLDGDCTLKPGWIDAAQAAMAAEADLAVVFGRRAERHPEASLYNAQCDREWDVPVGEVRACGGDALMRVGALVAVEGYCDELIAGEEPDLCLRMRARGWRIRRIDAPMTRHDADIHRFRAWWRRAIRSGHAYAEHVARHGPAADPDWRRQVHSTFVWALALPLTALTALALAAFISPLFLWLALAVVALYPLQYLRLAMRGIRSGEPASYARGNARLLILAKFALLAGMARFWSKRLAGRSGGIIEYKKG